MDVFISHSHRDIPHAKTLKEKLYSDFKLQSFVDSIDWANNTGYQSASDRIQTLMLREEMRRCRGLIFIYSKHTQAKPNNIISFLPFTFKKIFLSESSKPLSLWIPWELGYMDALTGKCAILSRTNNKMPINYREQEYLDIYPALMEDEKTKKYIVFGDGDEKVKFNTWLKQ